MYRSILVAVDGSGPSSRALGEAVRLAADQGARLRAAHVIDLSVALASWADAALIDLDDVVPTLRTAGTAILEAALEEARGAGVAAESVMLETSLGDAAGEILAEATRWGADLVVMGTHGRHGLAHLILGSVAEGVVRHATVPVLLIRGSDEPRPAS